MSRNTLSVRPYCSVTDYWWTELEDVFYLQVALLIYIIK